MMKTLFIFAATLLFLSAIIVRFRQRSAAAFHRLARLAEQKDDTAINQTIDWAKSKSMLSNMQDRLGRAGFFNEAERKAVRLLALWFVITGGSLGLAAGLGNSLGTIGGTLAVVIFTSIGAYLGITAWFLFLQLRGRDYRRELMYQLPLSLEALILLVESGLGILPAIAQYISAKDQTGREKNPVTRILKLVYDLSSHGVPFGTALELVSDAGDLKVLRHVLLHLDISGNEGGELIPSLRSLSDHSHLEWKLSVEQRVKRLENLVVFPVFTSVIGLMLLTAAVPMVPVLKFRETLETGKQAMRLVQDSAETIGQEGD